MKKNSKKQLTVKKFTVTDFNGINANDIKGGAADWWTGGCTDVCGSGVLSSTWNCTKQTCSQGCPTMCSLPCDK